MLSQYLLLLQRCKSASSDKPITGVFVNITCQSNLGIWRVITDVTVKSLMVKPLAMRTCEPAT